MLALLSLTGCGGDGSDTSSKPTPDRTAPIISAPISISVAAQNGAGAEASNAAISTFLSAVSASDNVDGSVVVSNDAPRFSLWA